MMSGGKDRYKEMADSLHNAPLNDVLPDFDKDAVWNELEPGLPRKKTVPLPYMRYAAVAALLLVLVSIGIWQVRKPEPLAVVKQEAKPVIVPETQQADSVVPEPIINNTVAERKPVRQNKPAKQISEPDLMPVATKSEVSDTAIHTREVAVLTDAEPDTIPALPRRTVRAVHLTDVGRELKSMVIKQPAPQSFGERVGYFIYGEETRDKEDNSPAGLRSLLKN